MWGLGQQSAVAKKANAWRGFLRTGRGDSYTQFFALNEAGGDAIYAASIELMLGPGKFVRVLDVLRDVAIRSTGAVRAAGLRA